MSDICGVTNLKCIRCNPGSCENREKEIKLLPCPCCGGEVLKYYSGSVGNGIFLEIICKECGIRTKRIREQEAIKAWNTRKPIDNIIKGIKKIAFPDFEEEYSCDGQEMLFLNDALKVVRKELGENDS